MNTKLFLLVFLLAGVSTTHAGQAQSKVAATASPKPETKLNINPVSVEWDQVISLKRVTPELRIGNSNYVVSGVLVEGLRLQRSSPERSPGQKLLELPVVRLFVPRPLPSPPAGGSYFRWGDSDRPWTAIAQDVITDRAFDEPVTHETDVRLISIHR